MPKGVAEVVAKGVEEEVLFQSVGEQLPKWVGEEVWLMKIVSVDVGEMEEGMCQVLG